jgi:membrane protein required for colicin V production
MECTMTWVDWAIIALLVFSVLGGLTQGFIRGIFSLAGLLLGLQLAAWNYQRVAEMLRPTISIEGLANTIAFIVITALVMLIAGLLGSLVANTFQKLGLGWLDRIVGGVFGLVQGVVLVILFILVTVAFFPQAHLLVDAKLPRMFFGALHLSTKVTPADLGDRVRDGLRLLRSETPSWMHS